MSYFLKPHSLPPLTHIGETLRQLIVTSLHYCPLVATAHHYSWAKGGEGQFYCSCS